MSSSTDAHATLAAFRQAVARFTPTPLHGSAEILAALRGKTVADVERYELRRDDRTLVHFTDGTALLVELSSGFAGSTTTPADPVEIEYALLTPTTQEGT